MTPTLLVGVDPRLTQGTEDALALAGAVAGALGARVRMLCAYPWSATVIEDEDMLRAAAERALALARACMDGIEVTSEAIPARAPAGALREAASRHDAKLLVVGPSHRGPVGHALTGDVAGSLLHDAPCPIAVAPRGYALRTPGEDRPRVPLIGVAFADTDAGRAALRVGFELAAHSDAPMRVIGVADPAELSLGRVLPERGRRELLLHEMVARELDAALERLGRPGGVEAVVLDGATPDVLAHASATLDLLVCGTEPHGPGGVLLGSTTRHLLHAAACPLVLVPPATETLTAPRSRRAPAPRSARRR